MQNPRCFSPFFIGELPLASSITPLSATLRSLGPLFVGELPLTDERTPRHDALLSSVPYSSGMPLQPSGQIYTCVNPCLFQSPLRRGCLFNTNGTTYYYVVSAFQSPLRRGYLFNQEITKTIQTVRQFQSPLHRGCLFS